MKGWFKDFPLTPALHMHTVLHYQHHSLEQYILDELTLTHHNHTQFIVCFQVRSWYCTVYDFGQSMLTYIHHYNTTQSISTVLWLFSPLPGKTGLFIIFIIFAISYSWNYTVHRLFRLASFPQWYTISILHVFSWLGSSFFFGLNNIPLSGCTKTYINPC